MKKIFILVFAIILNINVIAQCSLETAVDFTATDIHGNEIHLFDILDSGQYVLIDFFFVNCGSCEESVPHIVESYYAFGCNQHDVYYMAIDDLDNDEECHTWVQTYGIEYPTISGDAGGTAICSQYGIVYFPTVILIAPNRDILIQDLYPISNYKDIVTALSEHGIAQYDCGDFIVENITDNFSLYPNPADDFVKISGENLGNIGVFNVFGQKIDEFLADDELDIVTSNYENGVYFVKIGEKTQRFVVAH